MNSSTVLFNESKISIGQINALPYSVKLPGFSVYESDIQFQVVGNKIYYLWAEKDTNTWNDPDSIVISSSKLDGSGYSQIIKTDKNSVKLDPQFQVVDSKIYAIWINYDTSRLIMIALNTDGTGFEGERIITTAYERPQFQVVENKIYYAIEEVLIASSNLDGSDYRVIYDRNTDNSTGYIQFKVADSKIYAVWIETDDDFIYQFVASSTNLDGSHFKMFKTNSLSNFGKPQFQIVGDKIYYALLNHSVLNNDTDQVAVATSNLDLSDFKIFFQTNTNMDKCYEQLEVVGSKIHMTWQEGGNKIVMATLNTDGSNFNIDYEQVNVPFISKLQITESKAYYVWKKNRDKTDAWLELNILVSPIPIPTLTDKI
jgi:hypothetical protein